MAKVYHGDIPFHPDGTLAYYPVSWAKLTWRPNEEFKDILVFREFHRGRSAAYATFRRKIENTEVSVFLVDFEDMIPHMLNGHVFGKFVYCKRGRNYGCRLVHAYLDEDDFDGAT